ncbi:MAG: hypothetical protein QM765_34925 [Myxococcales bacterium]
MLTTLACLAALLASATEPGTSAAVRENPDAGRLTGAVERVIVFKDGHALLVKRLEARASGEGSVHTSEVPEAVLGAFWAQAEGREVQAMRAEWIESVTPKVEDGACLSTVELLRANAGKQVTLSTEKGEVQGKLLQVLDAPAAPVRPPAGGEVATVEVTPRGGELVAVETSKGRQVLGVAQVRTVLGPDLTLACRRTEVTAKREKRLTLELGKAAAGQSVKLRLFYFVPGIRWIPTYRLQTQSGASAELALQGELLNEVEDLDRVAVDLVVGVPNFKFKDTVSPLSLERTLRNALVTAAPGLMGADNNRFFNAMFSQRAMESSARPLDESEASGGAMGLASELAAERTQDLFSYEAKGVRLPKGARTTVALWKTNVAQRHVYTLDLAVHRSRDGYGYVDPESSGSSGGSPQRLQKNQVWHQLELTNASPQPWTTGAALVMQGELPVGQDLLPYTPSGARSLLPLTVAVDLQSAHAEEVVERKPNAVSVDGRYYTLVRKKGSITLKSFRSERSPIVVTFDTGGKVEAEGAKVVHGDWRPADGVEARVNGHANARWELDAGPEGVEDRDVPGGGVRVGLRFGAKRSAEPRGEVDLDDVTRRPPGSRASGA